MVQLIVSPFTSHNLFGKTSYLCTLMIEERNHIKEVVWLFLENWFEELANNFYYILLLVKIALYALKMKEQR